MHKRATWVVGGFVAAIVIAAALNAVLPRTSGRGRRATTSEAGEVTGSLVSAPPTLTTARCKRNQLGFRIERGLPNTRVARDYGAALHYLAGDECQFSARAVRIRIVASQGEGHGMLRVWSVSGARSFSGIYGPDVVDGRSLPFINTRFLPFRYSPKCGEHGPFRALARVGPYMASREIRVFRCGVTPPPFHLR